MRVWEWGQMKNFTSRQWQWMLCEVCIRDALMNILPYWQMVAVEHRHWQMACLAVVCHMDGLVHEGEENEHERRYQLGLGVMHEAYTIFFSHSFPLLPPCACIIYVTYYTLPKTPTICTTYYTNPTSISRDPTSFMWLMSRAFPDFHNNSTFMHYCQCELKIRGREG